MWSKTEIFFFSRKAQPPLKLWLRTLQCEWINILPRTPTIWFLLDSNALRLSLHLARICCKGNPEINQAQCGCSFFYLLLVASLRFGLVYVCVQFVFSAAAPHFLVRWISRFYSLCGVRRLYSVLAFLLWEQPWTLTSFFSSIGK